MYNVLLIGNPNVGKTTLFNSLTKSNEHTGNFHGVTVEEKNKTVVFDGVKYNFIDLPGIYSLNTFSFEEDVSKNQLLKTEATRVVVCDANSLRRNLYLCLQLNELGLNFKLLINNYDYYIKHENKLDINRLRKYFPSAEIINAKKIKPTSTILTPIDNKLSLTYLSDAIDKLINKRHLDKHTIINAFNGVVDNLTKDDKEIINELMPQVIASRYQYIDYILSDCISINKDFSYGKHGLDKLLLNPVIMILGFVLVFFLSIYCIFFLIGPFISNALVWFINKIIINPIISVLDMKFKNIWLTQFFSQGVFSSVITVITFLPQICLLFLFLTILEDSGLIARMAYVLDDLLLKVGLNGKAVYIMLMGFGCNTMSVMATRNMPDKNLKIKTAIINPFITCMARLPIFVIVASAFWGAKAYWIVVGLYLLSILIALFVSAILTKNVLKNKPTGLLLEFPPLKGIDVKHCLSSVKTNALEFTKRVFTTILSVSVIVYVLLHSKLNFSYTEDISNSILYLISSKLTFLFAPIGLNNAGVVSALIVGLLAKELIVSIFSITNNVATIPALITSLSLTISAISFTPASAIAFLIFSLLYSPCASTMAVIKKETGRFWMWFNIICQFTTAYMLAFIAYTCMTWGIMAMGVSLLIIFLIVLSITLIVKRIQKGRCVGCGKCF